MLRWIVLVSLLGGLWIAPRPQAEVPRAELIQTLGRGRPFEAGWTADGQTLVVATPHGIWLYPAEDYSAEPTLLGENYGELMSLAFHPSEAWVAAGYSGQGVVIWDVRAREAVRILPEASTLSLAFSHDEDWLASGGNGQVEIWETLSGFLYTRFYQKSAVKPLALAMGI